MIKSKKKIYIISKDYPFEGGNFLNSEIAIASKYYDLTVVYVQTENILRNQVKSLYEIPKNVRFFTCSYKVKKIELLISSFKYLFKKDFWEEIHFMKKKSLLNFFNFRYLLKYHYLGTIQFKALDKTLGKELQENPKNSILYTFWLTSETLGALYLKEKYSCKCFSRTHRYDLYFNRQVNAYLPLRPYMANNLDGLNPISEDGVIYLRNLIGDYKNLVLYRLGCQDLGLSSIDPHKPSYIVSVSNITRVKRLDRIIDALSLLNLKDLSWVHFGKGSLENEIMSYAKNKLDNINFEFKGAVANNKIYDFYLNNNILCLINTSESEGIPVSIMEAMSCGISIIATDVGGTSELVKDFYNGFLLPENASSKIIAEKIENLYEMEDTQVEILRSNARKSWEHNYNLETNTLKYYEYMCK